MIALAIDPEDTRVLYAATRFNGLFKTTNGGVNWMSINPAPTGTMFAIVHFALVVDPANTGTVYAGTFDGVLKTTDGGKNLGPLEQRPAGFNQGFCACRAVKATKGTEATGSQESRRRRDAQSAGHRASRGMDRARPHSQADTPIK